MSIASVLNNLNIGNRAVSESGKNVQSPDGSTKVDVLFQNNGLSGTGLITRRATAGFEFEQTISAASVYGASNAAFEYHTRLNTLLGLQNDPTSISNSLDTFVNGFDSTSHSIEKRANILANASSFASQVTRYADGLKDVKSTLETDITNTISAINNIILDIVSVNKTLGSSGQGVGSVLDQRDSLIAQLGEYLGIKCSFNDAGMATIRIAKGGKELVDNAHYVQISYYQDLDLLSHSSDSDTIRTTYYNLDGTMGRGADTQVGDVISQFGGRFAGLLNVRDSVLPTALANINNAVKQIAEKVNELQNSGSGFPPAPTLTSERTMLLTDKAAFKGKVNFSVTDNAGNPVLDTNGNYVKPVTVDFDKLSSRNSISGQFTAADVINEINQVAAGYSKASVGLGRVAVPVGAPAQWLIDQVRLVPTSDISAGGVMSFQLELNSGSSFDTQFQVTGMQVLDQATGTVIPQTNAFVLPDAITLSSGQNTKTGQNIIVNLNAAEQFNTVRLSMRVVGTNGVYEEKFADFIIGNAATANLRSAAIMNQRSEAVVSAGVAVVGGVSPARPPLVVGSNAAAATPAKLGAPIVSANFVDSNGLTVTDVNTQGYLKVSAVVGSGVVIDTATSTVLSTNATATEISKNFSHHFGLNNFFTSNATNPATDLAVRPDIVANPGLIALGKTQANSVTQNVMKGQVLPSATLNLAGLGNILDNDTVNINGTVFTFRLAMPALAAATDVAIGADHVASLQNLYNAVSTNATLTNVITITPPAGTSIMTITAKASGEILVDDNIAGGPSHWKHPAPFVGAALGPATTKLTGGYAGAVYDLRGGDAANGDTFTLNGVEFTFVDGAPGGNQVQRGAGGAPVTITNLKAALDASTDARIKGLFTFTINPLHTDQLIISASHAGSSGNALTIASSVFGRLKNPGDTRNNLPAAVLIGGVDIPSTDSVNTHALKIGPDTNNVFANLSTKSLNFDLSSTVSKQTIYSFFSSSFTTKMDHMFNDSERQFQVDEGVLQNLQIEFDSLTKLTSDTREEAHARFIELSQYVNMLLSVVNQFIKNREYLLRTIG